MEIIGIFRVLDRPPANIPRKVVKAASKAVILMFILNTTLVVEIKVSLILGLLSRILTSGYILVRIELNN